jgi:hypothetical protein
MKGNDDRCRYIVSRSWNWLSHGYHHSCERSEQFTNAIRQEISAELDDASLVKELRAAEAGKVRIILAFIDYC